MINNAPEENNEESNSDQMVEVRSVLKMKEEETKDNDDCGLWWRKTSEATTCGEGEGGGGSEGEGESTLWRYLEWNKKILLGKFSKQNQQYRR